MRRVNIRAILRDPIARRRMLRLSVRSILRFLQAERHPKSDIGDCNQRQSDFYALHEDDPPARGDCLHCGEREAADGRGYCEACLELPGFEESLEDDSLRGHIGSEADGTEHTRSDV